MHNFQIKGLITFLVPSTCFEHRVFIIRKIICTYSFFLWMFLMLKMQQKMSACKHTLKTACTNDLPDDEHMMFETCRRHQELNKTINLKIVHFVVLRLCSPKKNNPISTPPSGYIFSLFLLSVYNFFSLFTYSFPLGTESSGD